MLYFVHKKDDEQVCTLKYTRTLAAMIVNPQLCETGTEN